MKKLLFQNELFFPKLDPPVGILFKDLIKLFFENILRTLGKIIAFIVLLSPFFIFMDDGLEKGSILQYTYWIWSMIIIAYLVMSALYIIFKSWTWYFSYFKNFGKGNFKERYKSKSFKIYKELQNEFLDAKINKEPSKNFAELYQNQEICIYNELKKEFVAKFIKKTEKIYSTNIDNEILRLEDEFDNLIERVKNPGF